MKKVISVMILLAFFGSMIVMTGCFGGDDGGVLGIGIAVFAIAIIASGGTASPAVFAANTRAATRLAIAKDSTDVSIRVIPLDDKGAEVGEGYLVSSTSITWAGDTNSDGANELKATVSNIPTLDGYNQYRIKVFKGTNVILETIKFLKLSEKQNTTVNAIVNPTTTAKTIGFDKWNTGSTERYFNAFEQNAAAADFTALTTTIDNQLSTDNFDYRTDGTAVTAPDVTTTTPVNYEVKGYVKALDGSASTDTIINVYLGSNTEVYTHPVYTREGNFTVSLPNGEYRIVATKANHTYTPAERTITVKNDDVVNVDFAATSFAASIK